MITSLRKKVVMINFLSACLILFVAVIVTSLIGYRRIRTERDNRLDMALKYSQETNADEFLLSNLFKDIIVAEYDVSQQKVVWQLSGDSFEVEPEEVEKLVTRAVEDNADVGWVSMRIRYKTVPTEIGYKVGLNNFTSSYNNLVTFFAFGLGFLVLGSVGYLWISMSLANISLGPVEDSWRKQKQFVADASHELKTPVSVIMANTDILIAHQDETVKSQMRWVENTREETQRMAGLVADLLFLAKNDDGLQVQFEDINVSDCVSTIVLGYEALFYENSKLFSYQIEDGVHMEGSQGQIKQLATILLDNANKYSTGQGDIILNLSSTPKKITLSVANNCEQLTPDQMEHLFDRFYTVDPSRNKNSGGNGLGLSIAKIICETHGGILRADCVDGRITFTATFTRKKHKI